MNQNQWARLFEVLCFIGLIPFAYFWSMYFKTFRFHPNAIQNCYIGTCGLSSWDTFVSSLLSILGIIVYFVLCIGVLATFAYIYNDFGNDKTNK